MSSDMDNLRKAAGVLDTVLEVAQCYFAARHFETMALHQETNNPLFHSSAYQFGCAEEEVHDLRARLKAELAELEAPNADI